MFVADLGDFFQGAEGVGCFCMSRLTFVAGHGFSVWRRWVDVGGYFSFSKSIIFNDITFYDDGVA